MRSLLIGQFADLRLEVEDDEEYKLIGISKILYKYKYKLYY